MSATRPDAGHARPGALAVAGCIAWACAWLGAAFAGCVLIIAAAGLLAWRTYTVHLRDEAALWLEMEQGG